MALIAPALLLVHPNGNGSRQIRLEWAAILLASLATSTSASSYLFTLLILPACFLLASVRRERSCVPHAIVLALYAATGVLGGTNEGGEGWLALLVVPRLYTVILLCLLTYTLLIKQSSKGSSLNLAAWVVALCAILAFGITSNVRHQQGLFADYQWRIAAPKDIYMAVDPAIQQGDLLFIAMMGDGYHAAGYHLGAIQFSPASPDDYLALTAADGERWVEQARHESTVISSKQGAREVRDAESPAVSFDGRRLAFLRTDHGRGRIWLRALDQSDKLDRPVTPPELNVLEMSFLPSGELIFAAASESRPALFATDQAAGVRPLGIEDARYPAVSPDGRWLAYSELQGGDWNLWLRNLNSGETQRFTHADCNSVEPAWTADSQTLVYASDCGRALWFTTLCRRPAFR